MLPNQRVGIYVRESRDDKGERLETIETQKSLLLQFAAQAHLGIVCAVYVDDNVSGVQFERPGLGRLQEDVEHHRIDVLLLKDLSRLGRSNARTLLFLEFLQDHGVRVLTFDGRYDSDRDAETVGIDSWYNERYVMDISRKIRSNLRHKMECGEYLGNAPYGYRKSTAEKGKLIICPEEAAIVEEIFDLYCLEYGYKKIADMLNQRHVAPPGETRSLSGLWSSTTVRRILQNRVYLGDTIQGISEKVSYKSKKTRSLPPSRWVITRDTHAAIISPTQFEEVSAIRNRRKNGGDRYKGRRNLFQGFLFCADCGAPLFARKQQGRESGYLCSRYLKEGSQACSRHFIRENFLVRIVFRDVETMVWHFLENHPAFQLSQELLRRQMEKERQNRCQNEDAAVRLKRMKRKQQLLYEDRLEERITPEFFSHMQTVLLTQQKALEAECQEWRQLQETREASLRSLPEQLLDCLHAFAEGSWEERPELARQFLNCVLDKISVGRDQVSVHYKFPCLLPDNRVESSP